MCGRFSETKLLEAYDRRMRLKSQITGFTPRYNIAPTQGAPVVVRAEENVLKLMRWGLVPPWAEDESIGNRMINARAESLAQKPSVRRAFKRRPTAMVSTRRRTSFTRAEQGVVTALICPAFSPCVSSARGRDVVPCFQELHIFVCSR